MSEIDVEGQQKLLDSHVLIVGAGGLGSPVATYLSASGVGTLTICDFDEVELSNLQRQPIHNEARIGINKALSAREDLNRINPDCRVTAITERVDESTIEPLISAADVVVDACDNFQTRHLINRVAHKTQTPLVSGAAIHLTGQLSVYRYAEANSSCYACLVPENTEVPEQRCATMGVLSPVTGTIGTLQATEAIKLIVKGQSQLEGTLLLYDAMSVEFYRVPLMKNPTCSVCGI